MRSKRLLISALAALCLSGGAVWAQRGRGQGRPPSGSHGAMGAPSVHGAASERHSRVDSRTTSPGNATSRSSAAHGTTVASRLEQNPALASRLQRLLPAGAEVPQASAGFKNLGQFVAAAHASDNLDIPFDQLKARMTGPDSRSLGETIRQLRPELDSKAAKNEARKAEKQAKEDLEATQQ